MSMTTGGSNPTTLDHEVYAQLVVGDSADEAAAMLEHENSFVRLEAARLLAGRAAAVRAPDGASLRRALLAAAKGEHPEKSKFATGKHSSTEVPSDLTSAIQTAAAAALVGAEVEAAEQPALLARVLRHRDADVVCAALRAWGSVAALPSLIDALDDTRDAVNVAAAEVIGPLGAAAAEAAPALERRSRAGAEEVKAAARTALQRIGGR
jgi:hypothetical protein